MRLFLFSAVLVLGAGAIGAHLLRASRFVTAHQQVTGPFLLFSLNSLGDVRWRCSAKARTGKDTFALQYRQARTTATTFVRLVVASHTMKTARIEPGHAIRFPFIRPARQRLILVERHEPGTLTAVIEVDFHRPYRQPFYSACWSYMPPPANASIRFRPS
jgi:hypothetical protein